MATRPAGKAGSWYNADPKKLEDELKGRLAAVPDTIDDHQLPISGARVIIAPHAGYMHSGACAAWAYKCLDLSRAKRVFVLGPAHAYLLYGCAGSTFGKYATPLGDLVVDQDVVEQVKEATKVASSPIDDDETASIETDDDEMGSIPVDDETTEHSLEMHMPYLYLRCKETFGSPEHFPKIVPFLIGNNNREEEKTIGQALLPYLEDPENAFIVSSDFCHWGKHYGYMVYSHDSDPHNLRNLRSYGPKPKGPPIHKTIELIDELAMDAVESGKHDAFIDTLKLTKNTVCGRHPIGVMMAALELLVQNPEFEGKGRFSVTQYARSNLVEDVGQFSVSYVSAYAII